MSKLKPVPKAALPIIKIIREESTRPQRLPLPNPCGILRFNDGYCPMGMCRKSTYVTPSGPWSFRYSVSEAVIKTFANWWDSIPAKLAKQAVERVWGRPSKRKESH